MTIEYKGKVYTSEDAGKEIKVLDEEDSSLRTVYTLYPGDKNSGGEVVEEPQRLISAGDSYLGGGSFKPEWIPDGGIVVHELYPGGEPLTIIKDGKEQAFTGK